jgi:hypothetical protein
MGPAAYKSPFSFCSLAFGSIPMRAMRITLLALALATACSRDAKDPVAVAALGEGVATFPAETRMLVGVSFPKVAGSNVGGQVLDWALAADPQQQALLTQLLAECKIDPKRDLQTALIAMGEGREQVSMLVRGNLDEGTIVGCVRKAIAAKGGAVDARKIHDRTVWVARDPQGGTETWFTVDTGRGALIATSEAWLARSLDPAAAKLPTRADLMALVNRVDPAGPLWAAALMRPETGQRLIELTKGRVKGPAASFTIETRFEAGVEVAWSIDMQSEADAIVLVDFARSQQTWLAMAAYRYGLNKIISKMTFAPDGRMVKIGLHLDDAEVAQLADGLAKLAAN